MKPNFVHLRVHSEYSFIDGLIQPAAAIEHAKSYHMPAMALTDYTNLCGLIRFYRAAIQSGIKPLIGADILLEQDKHPEQYWQMTLLAMNQTGYHNLRSLLSTAYLTNQVVQRALLKTSWLEAQNEGLILLSGARHGDVGEACLNNDSALAEQRARRWIEIFPNRYYIELQRTGHNDDEHVLNESIQLAHRIQCPVVATNAVCFLKQSDYHAHEVRVCISEGTQLDNTQRTTDRYTDQQYLRSSEEMHELFKDIPSALSNSIEIAKRCTVEISLGAYHLPDYPVPHGTSEAEYFRTLSIDGLQKRLHQNRETELSQDQHAIYQARLELEIGTIIDMGFPGYFLVVMDFIRWAKQQGIPVGPGRGSGAGSLVAYALEITDVDPLQYDLLFERFLNPERVSMPDFDVDFCRERRDEVIQYVTNRYGQDAVSQIVTFNTLSAKAVVRDVARVQGKSYALADKIARLIPFDLGIRLEQAKKDVPALKQLIQQDPDVQDIWSMALRLEGTVRGISRHAGGVVIAPNKLTDFTPMFYEISTGIQMSQFDKDDIETIGLVKFDFLGLKTLTVIDWTLKQINEQHTEQKIEPLLIENIPLEDKQVFHYLNTGNPLGVFQLESRGMKDLIKRMHPDNFEDIIALIALFRPGPLQSGMVDHFVSRKHGHSELAYPHPDCQHSDLKPTLQSTYGIILYQEQVMQIAQILAGYNLGSADLLRRAMGKKNPADMAKQRKTFIQGAQEKDVSEKISTALFDLMEKFAGYGFNKSHSTAYAMLSYRTLWLKTHYPAEFMTAMLSSEIQNTIRLSFLIRDCRVLNIQVKPPTVNESEFHFILKNKVIIYGLGAIKGVGAAFVESLVAARADGDFKNLSDFCQRLAHDKLNKRALESLIQSGAMNCFEARRDVLMQGLERTLQQSQKAAFDQTVGMLHLFQEQQYQQPDDTPQVAWTDQQRIRKEKDVLGFYLTEHPFLHYKDEIRSRLPRNIEALQPSQSSVYIAGLLSMISQRRRPNGTSAHGFLEDDIGQIEIRVYEDTYPKVHSMLEEDNLVVIYGTVIRRQHSDALWIKVSNIMSILSFRMKDLQAIRLLCSSKIDAEQCTSRLSSYTYEKKSKAHCMIEIDYVGKTASAIFRLGSMFAVQPTDELLQQLKEQWGAACVKLNYQTL